MNAVIYARQSLDRDGSGDAVARQLEECRALAVRSSLAIAEEFIDNDVSATKGVRPAFSALLAGVRDGTISTIVVWHTDRLYRRVRDLVEIVELAEGHSLRILTCRAGDLDLSTPAGRMLAGMLGHAARYEIEQKSLRQKAAARQHAALGKDNFGVLPFGFRKVAGMVELDPAEAAVVREAYARFMAGEHLNAIVANFNARELATRRKRPWRVEGLGEVLRNPANAGYRRYLGQVVGKGNWPAILDEETWARYQRAIAHPGTRRDWSRAPQSLLGGIAECAVCGGLLSARRGYSGTNEQHPEAPRYGCRAGACVYRSRTLLDAYVTDALLSRLSTPGAAAELAPNPRVGILVRDAQDMQERLSEMQSRTPASAAEAIKIRAEARDLRKAIERADMNVDAARHAYPVVKLALADNVRLAWLRLSIEQQRAVVLSQMSVAVARQRNNKVFRAEDVDISWKVR